MTQQNGFTTTTNENKKFDISKILLNIETLKEEYFVKQIINEFHCPPRMPVKYRIINEATARTSKEPWFCGILKIPLEGLSDQEMESRFEELVQSIVVCTEYYGRATIISNGSKNPLRSYIKINKDIKVQS